MYRDEGKKTKKGNKILAKPFTLHHCYEVLWNEEKWKTCGLDVATLATNETREATIIDDDASSGDSKNRSSTPHSVPNTRRNMFGKKATKDLKGKKTEDDDIAKVMDRIANTRLQANEDRRQETWSTRSRRGGWHERRGWRPTRRVG
jgi:hypothetical protein